MARRRRAAAGARGGAAVGGDARRRLRSGHLVRPRGRHAVASGLRPRLLLRAHLQDDLVQPQGAADAPDGDAAGPPRRGGGEKKSPRRLLAAPDFFFQVPRAEADPFPPATATATALLAPPLGPDAVVAVALPPAVPPSSTMSTSPNLSPHLPASPRISPGAAQLDDVHCCSARLAADPGGRTQAAAQGAGRRKGGEEPRRGSRGEPRCVGREERGGAKGALGSAGSVRGMSETCLRHVRDVSETCPQASSSATGAGGARVDGSAGTALDAEYLPRSRGLRRARAYLPRSPQISPDLPRSPQISGVEGQ